MGLVSAFLSGPQEIIPAGQTKVELFVFTHDNLNKGTAKWQIKEGANTYNVTADAGGHGKILVPSGKTYTVTLTISGTYEGGKTTSFVANSCEVVLCHFILGDQVTKGGAQVITGAKHFSAQPTADTRAYNPANKTDLVSIKSLQESSDVVHTSGDQTIDGIKTFVRSPIVTANYANILLKSDLDNSNVIFFNDNSENHTTLIRSRNDDNLSAFTQIRTENHRTGTIGELFLRVDDVDGEGYVTLPMRSSPGSKDAVNTRYVLDRADEIVGYVNDTAVKKTGDTMSGNLSIEAGEQRGLLFKRTDRGYNSPWAKYRWDRVYDKDDKKVAELLVTCTNEDPNVGKVTSSTLSATNYKDDGTEVRSYLTVRAQSTGECYALVPMRATPGTTDIVNTRYVLDRVDEIVGYVNDGLAGKVGKTGIETISGTKTFTHPPFVTARYANLNLISELINSNILFHTNNQENYTTLIRSSDDNATYAETKIYTVNNRTAQSSLIVSRVDDNGDKYVTLDMRSSPGSSDAVNTKYVLDRVDEIVGYVNDQDAQKADKTEVNDGLALKADITYVNGAIQSAIQSSWDGVY